MIETSTPNFTQDRLTGATAQETPVQPSSPEQIERLEFKYIIPPNLIPELRAFVRLFCVPDKHAPGDPPQYTITTLQLDSPSLSLYKAVHLDTFNRFKLRARSYGDAQNVIHLEVKRKLHYRIIKSRAAVPRELWGRETALSPSRKIPFGSETS